MFRFFTILLLFCVCAHTALRAQEAAADTVTVTATATTQLPAFNARSYILPAALMVYGAAEATLASHVRLLNYVGNQQIEKLNPPKFPYDDYMQYAPTVGTFALKACGVRSRSRWADMSLTFALGASFTAITVNGLKYTVRERRPDSSSLNSFPSGHTTVAFMGAQMLWEEYRGTSLWIPIAGYTIAAATGALRVYNNRHWIGDVAFGAGLGIACTKLAYYTYPRLRALLSRRSTATAPAATALQWTATPYYNGRQGGLAIALTL